VRPVLIDMEEDSNSGPSDLDLKRIRALVVQQRNLETKIAAKTAELELLNKEYTKLSMEQLPGLFDEVGMSRVTLEDGTEVFIDKDVVANIKEDNKAAAFAWLRKNNFGSIIKNEVKASFGKGEDKKALSLFTALIKKGINCTQKEFIHPATLKSFVNERLEAGKPLAKEIDTHEIRKCKLKEPKASKASKSK